MYYIDKILNVIEARARTLEVIHARVLLEVRDNETADVDRRSRKCNRTFVRYNEEGM